MPSTRLNKFIASSGLCSRRKADELIESGVVFVNGKKLQNWVFWLEQKTRFLLIKSKSVLLNTNTTDFINLPATLQQLRTKKAGKQYMTYFLKVCII